MIDLSERMVKDQGIKSAPHDYQLDKHPTELPVPALQSNTEVSLEHLASKEVAFITRSN